MLEGIVTDKDLAFRVVAEGIDPRATMLRDIMTRRPVAITPDTSYADALAKMAEGRFRHLPVVDESVVVGVLDITRCLYEGMERLQKAYASSKALKDAFETVEKQWATYVFFGFLAVGAKIMCVCVAKSVICGLFTTFLGDFFNFLPLFLSFSPLFRHFSHHFSHFSHSFFFPFPPSFSTVFLFR